MINENELKEKLLKLVDELPALPLLKIEMGVKPACVEVDFNFAKSGMSYLEDSCGINKEEFKKLLHEYLDEPLKALIKKLQENEGKNIESILDSEFKKMFGGGLLRRMKYAISI